MKTWGICDRCGMKIASPHYHHKDRNHAHKSSKNLEILCARCHGKEHGQEVDLTGIIDTVFEMGKHRVGYRLTEAHKLSNGVEA